jgi:hypothetical protein
MGVLIPGIPYKSQVDPDANEFRNDCGPTCLAMALNAFKVEVSTNAVYRKTGAKANGYVSVSQLMRAAQAYGVPFDYFSGWNIAKLKEAVKQGKAAIPLVHYGSWSSTGKTQSNFTGPHFVVVVGYDDEYIYVHDPLWWGNRRKEGERKRWTYKEFEKAWKECSKDGNRNYSGILCTRKLSTDAWGQDAPAGETPPPPPPTYQVDPVTHLRLKAWAAYYKVPLPEINNPAVANAYITAMGTWGLRVAVHRVEESDTLGLIALRYYDDPLKWDVVMYFNGLGPGDTIYDNDVLIIPEPLEKPKDIPEGEVPQGGTFTPATGLTEETPQPA